MTQHAASRQYDDLTPQHVLDSLDAVGFRGDGRILQLNSYENRVFQLFLEDGRAVVTKFYRPARWTDAQILEEHAFHCNWLLPRCPWCRRWCCRWATPRPLRRN
jgi:Ser/Thr protein kinase RdoA (MazF antagonist)